MVDRVQLLTTCYMPLDGQWQIVYPGTVCDVPSQIAFAPTMITVLSPTEPAGTLGSHGKATAVRNVRTSR